MSHIMPTYGRLPVSFTQGEGVHLWDTEGQQYLDALSGIAVCNIGHTHPRVVDAICQQAGKLMHTSNLYGIEQQEALADRLAEKSGMEHVFFSNSGAEANEAAIKLARKYGHQKGIQTPTIIVMESAFHGRTMATLTATGNRKAQVGFEPLVSGFVRVPYNDIEAIHNVAKNNKDIVAILVEPVQGEGGVRVPTMGYLESLRKICDSNEWLLMVDEVQSGVGRTGQWFAHQHCGIKPDVMTLAKGLGNGMPIGACVVAGPAVGVLVAGNHGSTFGGNPLACAAANAVLDVIKDENLCERAAELGQYILDQFNARLTDNTHVKDIRGKGLMIGIELDQDAPHLVKAALEEHHLLINVTAGNVIRLLPPMIMTHAQADQMIEAVCALIETL